jgi:hypothetical protein
VRQQDLEALEQSHPHLIYRDFLGVVPRAVFMRVDQPPFNDVRVRHAISHAIDRQGLIEAIWGRDAPTRAVARGLSEEKMGTFIAVVVILGLTFVLWRGLRTVSERFSGERDQGRANMLGMAANVTLAVGLVLVGLLVLF